MDEKTSRVPITLMACCVLHNICIDVGDPCPIDIDEDDDRLDESSFNGDVSPVASDTSLSDSSEGSPRSEHSLDGPDWESLRFLM
ncbi:hypothetical protein OS493_025475 [Desmophyllum pertusum]|uniref:Uncharacterized protein n=1 Tax=Desmophyllum pertusum TaxID=174260 RepID=A0A9W9YLI3_9CNID|nr:hypothetical protein OS493_025475 [Desmophyllum pertusum]